MLKEIAHFAAFAAPTVVMKWLMAPAEVRRILVARENRAGMGERRRALARELRGRILEIGAGDGALFPYYPKEAMVTALEPSPAFRKRAREAASSAAARIQVVPGVGENLPFADESFDQVVLSMVLCSVGSVDGVLAEARRVLRPGGTLHLMEHVRSERLVEGAIQDWLNPLWQFLYRTGCHVNRDVDGALARAGFRREEESRFKIFTRGVPAMPMKMIRARKQGSGDPAASPGVAPSIRRASPLPRPVRLRQAPTGTGCGAAAHRTVATAEVTT